MVFDFPSRSPVTAQLPLSTSRSRFSDGIQHSFVSDHEQLGTRIHRGYEGIAFAELLRAHSADRYSLAFTGLPTSEEDLAMASERTA